MKNIVQLKSSIQFYRQNLNWPLISIRSCQKILNWTLQFNSQAVIAQTYSRSKYKLGQEINFKFWSLKCLNWQLFASTMNMFLFEMPKSGVLKAKFNFKYTPEVRFTKLKTLLS